MCGIAGFQLSKREIEALRKNEDFDLATFSQLLSIHLLDGIEHRGRDATGAAWFGEDNEVIVNKYGCNATNWVKHGNYAGIRGDTVILHTRAGTGGLASDNRNNHPIITPNVTGVHNGIIWNEDDIFRKYKKNFKRIGEVDSEILFQIIGDPDLGLTKVVEDVKGDAAIAWLINSDDQHRLHLAGLGARPLEIALTHLGSLIFASEARAIKKAADECGLELTWTTIDNDGYAMVARDGQLTHRWACGELKRGSVGGGFGGRRQTHGTPSGTTTTGRSTSGTSGPNGTSGRTTGASDYTHRVSVACKNFPKSLRPNYYHGGRCPTCTKFQGCVCRYNTAPLPPYPPVPTDLEAAGWFELAEADQGAENGVEFFNPTHGAPVYPKLRALGGYLVDLKTWQNWVEELRDMDELIAWEKLILAETIDGDAQPEGWKIGDAKYGDIVRFMNEGTGEFIYWWKRGAHTSQSIDHTKVKALIADRRWAETTKEGVRPMPTATFERDSVWLKAGDFIMYSGFKGGMVWKVLDDGSELREDFYDVMFLGEDPHYVTDIGTRRARGGGADAESKSGDSGGALDAATDVDLSAIDPSDEQAVRDAVDAIWGRTFPGDDRRGDAEQLVREEMIQQEEENQQEYDLEKACDAIDFAMFDEVVHSYVVGKLENTGKRVTWLFHYHSGRFVAVCDDGSRWSYDEDGVKTGNIEGPNAMEGTIQWLKRQINGRRGVAEHVKGTGENDTGWFQCGSNVEKIEVERSVPLRDWDDDEVVDDGDVSGGVSGGGEDNTNDNEENINA